MDRAADVRVLASPKNWIDERRGQAERRRWRAHHELERGNPVRVIQP